MGRYRFLSAICFFLLILSGARSAAQSNEESLGDAARRIRAEKTNKQSITGSQPVASTKSATTTQPTVDAGEIWQGLFDRAEQAMQEAEYVTAEDLFRKAIDCAEQNKLSAAMIAGSYDGLGSALRIERKYGDSEAAYRNALQIWRKAPGDNDESIARSKAGLGITLVGLSRYAEAEQLLMESLSTYHEHPDASICAQSIPLNGLAMLYRSNHEYSKGERIYTETFALLTNKQDTPCENFVALLDHLAGLYADDNQWEKVEKVQQGAIGLALGMRGPRSEIYGDTIYAFAQTLSKRRRFEEAAATAGKAADVFRNCETPATSKLAQTLEFQEMNLQLAGKSEEAKQVHAATTAAAAAANNRGEPTDAMMSIRARAQEARVNGNGEEEARLIAQEVAASKKLGAFYQIVALNDSAMLHQEQQKPAEAEAELKQALELSIASTGNSSRSTAEAHLALGTFFMNNQRLAEAEESYGAALGLLGPQDGEQVRRIFASLGWTYMSQGKLDRAESVYQRMLKAAEDNHDDASVSGTLLNLAMVYQKTKRPNEAEAALTRSMNIASQLPKPMDRLWAPAALSAAMFYEQSGKSLQAEQLYVQVIAFVEKQTGANNPALRLPLQRLVALLKERGQTAEAEKYQARADKLPPMPTMPAMPAMQR